MSEVVFQGLGSHVTSTVSSNYIVLFDYVARDQGSPNNYAETQYFSIGSNIFNCLPYFFSVGLRH
jgi:hypothetical protein